MRAEPKPVIQGYKVLQRITVAVRSQADLGRVLDLLVMDAGRLLDLSLCAIARWEESGTCLLVSQAYSRASAGVGRHELQGCSIAPEAAGSTLQSVVFKEHRPLIVHGDRGNGPEAVRIDAAFGGDGSSILARSAIVIAPLLTDQRVAGFLLTARSAELPDWSESDVEFVVAAADLAAVALQHAGMRSVLRGLASTAAELNSPLKLATLLRKMTEAAMLCTQSTMGLSGVREGDLMICRELRRRGSWEPVDLRFDRERGLPGWSWTHRAPCIANEAATDPRADRSFVDRYGVRSALSVPIVDRAGEVLGFFELHNKAAGIPYGDEDVQLATALAHMTAMGLGAIR